MEKQKIWKTEIERRMDKITKKIEKIFHRQKDNKQVLELKKY